MAVLEGDKIKKWYNVLWKDGLGDEAGPSHASKVSYTYMK